VNRYILNVYGTQGSGKSYLTKRLIRQMRGRVFILDTMAEYDVGMIFRAEEYEGRTYTAVQKLRAQLIAEGEGRRPTPGAYVIRTERRDLAEQTVQQFFDFIDRVQAAGHYVIDEASKFMSAREIRPELGDAIDYGRHQRQNLVFVARRPTQLHTDARANATAVVTFQQQYEGDKRKLSSFDGHAPDVVPKLRYSDHEYAVLGTGQHQLPFYDWLTSRAECAYFNDPRNQPA